MQTQSRNVAQRALATSALTYSVSMTTAPKAVRPKRRGISPVMVDPEDLAQTTLVVASRSASSRSKGEDEVGTTSESSRSVR